MRTSNSDVIARAIAAGLTVKFIDTDGEPMWLDNSGLWWWSFGKPTLHTMTNIYGIEDVVGELEWEIL